MTKVCKKMSEQSAYLCTAGTHIGRITRQHYEKRDECPCQVTHVKPCIYEAGVRATYLMKFIQICVILILRVRLSSSALLDSTRAACSGSQPRSLTVRMFFNTGRTQHELAIYCGGGLIRTLNDQRDPLVALSRESADVDGVATRDSSPAVSSPSHIVSRGH